MNETFISYANLALHWLLDHGIKIAGIAVGAILINRFGIMLIGKAVHRFLMAQDFISGDTQEQKRQETIVRILSKTLKVAVWSMTVLMILPEVGIKIGPLLAGVGIAGVALGFGAQYLIRDLISGLFIIMENQYRVGDVVSLDGTAGVVEDMSLRTTTLRDLDGTVHHVLHGDIKRSSNLSHKFARVNLNVGVSYDANLEKVISVINAVGSALADDPQWKEHVLKAPQFLRVDEFADSAIMIKILGDTKPLKQWDVTGELRKRLKVAFDREGINIPFPQRVIHQAVQK